MSKVRTERDGQVLTVILDRPEVRNAVDDQTAEEMVAAFHELESDDSLAVGRLVGNRGKLLCRCRFEGRGERRTNDTFRSQPILCTTRSDGTLTNGAQQTGHRRDQRSCRRRWFGIGVVV